MKKQAGLGRAGSEQLLLRIPNAESRRLLNHRQDVFFAHDQKFLAIDLDLGAAVLAEQHLVTLLDGDRTDLAVFEDLAVAGGDDFAANGLLGSGVRNHDAAGGDLLLLQALDDHAVVQGAQCHSGWSLKGWLKVADSKREFAGC